jgi:hypothetical protein
MAGAVIWRLPGSGHPRQAFVGGQPNVSAMPLLNEAAEASRVASSNKWFPHCKCTLDLRGANRTRFKIRAALRRPGLEFPDLIPNL